MEEEQTDIKGRRPAVHGDASPASSLSIKGFEKGLIKILSAACAPILQPVHAKQRQDYEKSEDKAEQYPGDRFQP